MPKALYFSLMVGLGGFAGALARYGVSLACQRGSIVFPLGTLAANLLGCLLIGIIAQLATETNWIPPAMRLLLATGFCGGFTTLSAFAFETVQFVRSAEWFLAGAYVLGTLIGAFLAFGLGCLLVLLVLKGPGALWN
jgi:CrcB protein